MTKLRDFSWWPSAWIDKSGGSISPTEITNAPLKNVRRAGRELILMVEHNGSVCTATFGSSLSEDLIILLRHILLQHWGEPVSAVEHIEIDLAALENIGKL